MMKLIKPRQMKKPKTIQERIASEFYPAQQTVIMQQIQDEPEAYKLEVTQKDPCRIYRDGVYLGKVKNVIEWKCDKLVIGAEWVANPH